jgi:uncharacterized membrane protein YfcA
MAQPRDCPLPALPACHAAPMMQARRRIASSMLSDPALTLPSIAVLCLGAFLGAISSGAVGFAFAVIAASLWLHVFEPIRVTFLITSCSVVLQSSLIWPMRHSIAFGRLWPFLLGAAFGIPLGVQVVAYTDQDILKPALGIFLVAFGLYALFAPRLPRIGGNRALDTIIGFIGGILGGVGGYSGVIPTIWTQLRHWPKDIARGVYQPYILITQMATLTLIGFVAFSTTDAILLLIALPPLILGAFVGWSLYGRLDEKRFKQLMAVLLIGSGATLVF